jgi:hypothetical protein
MIARQLALTLTALFTGAAGTSPSPSSPRGWPWTTEPS